MRAARKSTFSLAQGAVLWGEFGQWLDLLLALLLEQCGATQNASWIRMLLKDMVGPWGLEPQTSQVLTTTSKAVGDCQVLDNTQ